MLLICSFLPVSPGCRPQLPRCAVFPQNPRPLRHTQRPPPHPTSPSIPLVSPLRDNSSVLQESERPHRRSHRSVVTPCVFATFPNHLTLPLPVPRYSGSVGSWRSRQTRHVPSGHRVINHSHRFLEQGLLLRTHVSLSFSRGIL